MRGTRTEMTLGEEWPPKRLGSAPRTARPAGDLATSYRRRLATA